jgi:hypothetical protein
MFVSGLLSLHISNPRFQAALRAGQLSFILEHAGQITMDLPDEIRVCRLIAEQEPAGLELAAAEWIVGFAERLAALGAEHGLDG